MTINWQHLLYSVTLYIRTYMTGPRVLIFILTVAVIISIRKILFERIDMNPSSENTRRIGLRDSLLTIGYIIYSFKNINKSRMSYDQWRISRS